MDLIMVWVGLLTLLMDKHFHKTNPLSKIINRQKDPQKKKPAAVRRKKNVHWRRNASPKTFFIIINHPFPPIQTQGQNNPPPSQNEAPQTHTYVGLTSSKFKERLGNHKQIFQAQKIWPRNNPQPKNMAT